ncbi:hypothetical protein [Streptomyces sp. WELS2]|uniref:hypothetical protein n=1 Tax=Streptomyces sp. WELS2 TaxID=2749435 RepID=UPI0015F11AB5|nr:hypothetical protein [Streptomyces sp. WELS2]
MTEVGLAVGLLYWFARLPELTLIAAPALAAMVAWRELPGADRTSQVANFAVIEALILGWAAARGRLAARSGQRRLVERAAGVRYRLPEPVGPLVRGSIPLAAGLVRCAVTAGAVLLGLSGIRADERHADRAAHITATVTHRGEETVRVRTADERRITVDAFYPEDHVVGSTVTVLEDGSWRRLVAEPYDAFGWQLLALTAGLPGLSFLTVGVLARRRAAALRRAPVPALRVVTTDRAGDPVVIRTVGPVRRPRTSEKPLLKALSDTGSDVRMTEEVSALHVHPELRPAEASPRSDQGLPLGPVLLLLVGFAVTAVLVT